MDGKWLESGEWGQVGDSQDCHPREFGLHLVTGDGAPCGIRSPQLSWLRHSLSSWKEGTPIHGTDETNRARPRWCCRGTAVVLSTGPVGAPGDVAAPPSRLHPRWWEGTGAHMPVPSEGMTRRWHTAVVTPLSRLSHVATPGCRVAGRQVWALCQMEISAMLGMPRSPLYVVEQF